VSLIKRQWAITHRHPHTGCKRLQFKSPKFASL
jgi:hypothetical protein